MSPIQPNHDRSIENALSYSANHPCPDRTLPENPMINKLQSMLHDRRNRANLYCRAEYWDRKADAMRGHAVSMWPNNALNEYYHREDLQAIHDGLNDVHGLRILDVGCGTGRMSRHLAKQGAQVHGFDFSSKAIEIAESLSDAPNPTYEVLSLFDLETESSHDIALSWGVVTVACTDGEQLADALRRIYRTLKPGGKLLMLEPVHAGFLHRVLRMNLREFTHIMTRAGFDIHSIRHLHCWPIRLILAYVPWPRWFTTPVYWIGESFMRATGRHFLGDYKAILATRRD